MCMHNNATVEHHAHAIKFLYNMPYTLLFIPYYDLFIAARFALSQLCLKHCVAHAGVQQGASEASPPACIYYY